MAYTAGKQAGSERKMRRQGVEESGENASVHQHQRQSARTRPRPGPRQCQATTVGQRMKRHYKRRQTSKARLKKRNRCVRRHGDGIGIGGPLAWPACANYKCE